MKIAFIADVHIDNHRIHGGHLVAGLNARACGIATALRDACAIARHEGADLLVVAGDLFDTTRPSPQIIAATQQALVGIPTVLLMGNHDRNSGVPGDHALGPMLGQMVATIPGRHELSESADDVALMLPFDARPAESWMPQAIISLAAEARAHGQRPVCAVAHVGIHDAQIRASSPWLTGSHDAIAMESLRAALFTAGVPAFFAGNWHTHKQWKWAAEGTTITQIGALVPTGWDNPGVAGYGSVILYDCASGAVTRDEVRGPRFVTVQTEAELDAEMARAKASNCTLSARWRVAPAQAQAAREVLAEKCPTGSEVVLDAKAASALASSAAKSARGAPTMVAALRGYVARMDLDVGPDAGPLVAAMRAQVLRDCLTLLKL